MKDYQRLTVKNVGRYTQIKDDYSTFDCLRRLAELEDKIEDGKLFFAPQNQDELLWVSSLLMIISFGDEVKNERLKEIYKELIEIKVKNE